MNAGPANYTPEAQSDELGRSAAEDLLLSARFLAWYTSAMFAIETLLLSLVSVAPGAESRFLILQGIPATLVVVFAVIGVILRWLPQDHWFNRSLVVRGVLVFAALSSTLLLVAIV
jgi:hypothetical protein